MSVRLEQARSRYARALAASPGVDDPRVPLAFEVVPRERFLGPGPWKILSADGYVETASSDPMLIYDNIVIGLAPEKQINNGQPSLHARALSAARIRPGEHVLHIGCGTGYYSAVLAELVTLSGTVCAWDVQAELVDAATVNLQPWPNASAALRNGTETALPDCDVIYVCAGCTRPIKAWVEALSIGGRLVFPLTPGWDVGGMLMVTREADRYGARFLCRCSFIPCIGGSVPGEEAALREAFAAGNLESVSSLHFGPCDDDAHAWIVGDDWWLGTPKGNALQ
jgi:protein-L-isoaspartate(D-aspartate) O-methyltransferase